MCTLLLQAYNSQVAIKVHSSSHSFYRISALQFYKGMTIHKWLGIGDCHLPCKSILQNILSNNAYSEVKTRIEKTSTLIIDEIGMLSSQNFEDIEYLCRKVRQLDLLFGGLQVITSGCFKQLPPVPSANDPGEYAFMSPIFKSVSTQVAFDSGCETK